VPQTAPAKPPVEAGLCATCAHARLITSSRGSWFSICELSAVDEGFPKYPRLPVTSCIGYRRVPEVVD
jgi:hypothetical protein